MPTQADLVTQHHEVLDITRKVSVLMVVANPAIHPILGWTLGFWASELKHPWSEFTEAGYEVTIASPDGGKVMVDGLSDPRDPSKWFASDITSLGFLSSPNCIALLEDTPTLAAFSYADYDELIVCGGQSSLYTFRENEDLRTAIRQFCEAGKLTAVFCHGVSALVDVMLSDGSYPVDGKTVTGSLMLKKIIPTPSLDRLLCRGDLKMRSRRGVRTTCRPVDSRRFVYATAT